MKAEIKKIAKTLVDHTDGKSDEEIKGAIKDVVKYMADNNLLGHWRDLIDALHAAWKDKYGVSSVKIISAHALTAEAEQKLKELSSGADLESRVDERLIGGAIMRIDDKRIDGSISGALRRLKMKIYG